MVYSEQIAERLDMPRLRERLDADGYATLPRLAAGSSSEAVAAGIGEPIAPSKGSVVQKLVPRAISTPNTYSGIFGLNRFPFHTDLAHWRVPPRYFLLRCVRGYADVPTLLLDGLDLIAQVGAGVLARALVRPRRPQCGEVRMLRLRQRDTVGDIFRWDQTYLRPASPIGELAFERVRAHLEAAVPKSVAIVNDGDVLIIDNWRMLHSRPAVPADRQDRHLERVYLRSLT